MELPKIYVDFAQVHVGSGVIRFRRSNDLRVMAIALSEVADYINMRMHEGSWVYRW